MIEAQKWIVEVLLMLCLLILLGITYVKYSQVVELEQDYNRLLKQTVELANAYNYVARAHNWQGEHTCVLTDATQAAEEWEEIQSKLAPTWGTWKKP